MITPLTGSASKSDGACGEIQLALHDVCQLDGYYLPEWLKNWKELPEIQRAWWEAFPPSKGNDVRRQETPTRTRTRAAE